MIRPPFLPLMLSLAGVCVPAAVLLAQCPPNVQIIGFGDLVSGCISTAGEIDSHYFTSTASSPADIVLVQAALTGGPSSFNPCITIRNQAGAALVSTCHDYVCWIWSYQLPGPGLYRIDVEDDDHFQTGNYNLLLQRRNPPADAVPLTVGYPLLGNLSTIGGMDVYTFSGTAGSSVTITSTIQGASCSCFNPTIYVLRANGTEIASASHDYTVTLTVSLPVTGPYYILFEDDDIYATGTYNLQLTCNSGPCVTPILTGTPAPGNTVTFTLLVPNAATVFPNAAPGYFMALALDRTPGIPLGDGRIIPLNPDPVLFLCLSDPAQVGLDHNVGILGPGGFASVTWSIPGVAPHGCAVYAAFMLFDVSMNPPAASGVLALPPPLRVNIL